MSKEHKYRSRVHMALLYPDNESHMKALEKIKQSFDFAFILHDSDVDEDGVLKKSHYHVIIRTQNAQWNTALAKELSIEPNYFEQCRSLDNSLLYLLHYNDSNKHQYDITEVEGTLRGRLNSAMNNQNKNEGEKVTELIDYIRKCPERITVSAFASFCAREGYWSEFRRSATIFLKIIEEHNNKISS